MDSGCKVLFFILALFLSCCWASFSPFGDATACQICVPYPDITLADRILGKSEIIFAREAKNAPYTFTQAEILRGSGSVNPVKIFCDSSTRRKLQVYPESIVVLARQSSSEEWQLLTFADRPYQQLIRDIIENGSSWAKKDPSGERVRYFARHLANKNLQVREQAYLEVGRAPYSTIKVLASAISREQIYRLLRDYRYAEWHSLYILFLGQSEHPEDRSYIRNQVETAARIGITVNLSAWITAFIEAFPETGIEEIERWYFLKSNRSDEELTQLMVSMSVLATQQGNAHSSFFALRKRIVNSWSTLLINYPQMAGKVAKELVGLRVQAHLSILSELQEQGLIIDPSDSYILNYYLSMAPAWPAVGPNQFIFEDRYKDNKTH